MNSPKDLRFSDRGSMKPLQQDECGNADCETCLLTQICRGANPADDTVCTLCDQTVDELDGHVSAIGSQLQAAAEGPAAHRAGLKLIAEAAASRSVPFVESPVPAKIAAYRIGDIVGRGGMGAVYRATHTKLKKEVAIKLLPTATLKRTGAVARFEREMEAVGQLEHPNVVRALDAGEADGVSFLIMELIIGLDVNAVVADHGQLTVADACEIGRQAAVGLKYAHEMGLVHRDIKPANLMLSEDGEGHAVVKVMDLGLALVNQTASSEQLTDQGQLMGTLEFMAPEQASNSQVDERADIYALGATLFRLLTGTVPFDGAEFNTPVKRLYGLSNGAAPSIRSRRTDMPDDLAEFVDCMLSRNPNERPQSMEQVATALATFAAGHQLNQLLLKHQRQQSAAVSGVAKADTSPEAGSTFLTTAPAKASGNEQPSAAPAADLADQNATPPRRRWWLAAAALPLAAMLLAGVIWLKLTDGGYLRIDAAEDVKVTIDVLKDGEKVSELHVGTGKSEHWLKSGQYEVHLPKTASDRLTIEGETFTLARNGNPVVRIARVPKKTAFRPEAKGPAPAVVSEVKAVPVVSRRVVSNVNDSGPGSLRNAILKANETPGHDYISFAIPGNGPHTIVPSTALPVISDVVTIDGYSLAGARKNDREIGNNAALQIEINGEETTGVSGFEMAASNSTIRGLVINRFAAGVTVSGGAGNAVVGNFLGTNVTGSTAAGNQIGVRVVGGSRHRVGGSTLADRNVISGNEKEGVLVDASDGNTISGNYIGTNSSGDSPVANGEKAIHVANHSDGTIIGTNGDGVGDAAEGNLIAGRIAAGDNPTIYIGQAADTVIAGNIIGMNARGVADIDEEKSGQGIAVIRGTQTRIGTNGDGVSDLLERNIISGFQTGVRTRGPTSHTTIAGNYLGTDVTGNVAIGNHHGIFLFASGHNTVGGPKLAQRNVISGNSQFAIHSQYPCKGTTVMGNYIGVGADGTTVLGNLKGIQTSADWIVGTDGDGVDDETEGNIISGNDVGIEVESQVRLAGNRIGLDKNGKAAGNKTVGVKITGIESTVGTNGDGVSDELERNIISANGIGVQSSPVRIGQSGPIAGNFIGTDINGTRAIGNVNEGILLEGELSQLIGGDQPVERNVIAGNGGPGISLHRKTTKHRLLDNLIGTDLHGTEKVEGQSEGLRIEGGTLLVDGKVVLDGEVVVTGDGALSGSGTINGAATSTRDNSTDVIDMDRRNLVAVAVDNGCVRTKESAVRKAEEVAVEPNSN